MGPGPGGPGPGGPGPGGPMGPGPGQQMMNMMPGKWLISNFIPKKKRIFCRFSKYFSSKKLQLVPYLPSLKVLSLKNFFLE